jgi:hypothetical protein
MSPLSFSDEELDSLKILVVPDHGNCAFVQGPAMPPSWRWRASCRLAENAREKGRIGFGYGATLVRIARARAL